MTITLTGEPRSTNHVYKTTCRNGYAQTYLTPEGRALKEDYQWQARSQYHGEPLSEALKIAVTLFFGRRGRKDWDNFHKLSMDALSGIVWDDDSQVEEAVVRKAYDWQRPRIEITI